MGVDSKNRQLINVIRSKSAKVGSWAHSARFIPILVLTALVFIGAAGYQIYDYNRMLHQRNALIDEVESIYAQTLGGDLSVSDPVSELKSTMDEMNQSPIGDAVHRPNLTAVAILSDISERIPASVTVSFARFSFDRKQIKIDGLTDTFNDVDKIRTSLEASSFYSGVAIDSAANESNGQGVRFTFSLNL
jgi:general secretion pathway protein L